VTSAVKRAFGVGTVGVDMTVVSLGVAFFNVNTSDSISRVSRMTRAIERTLGVGAVGVVMAIVC